jgi:hypothetical protein
VKLPHLRIHNVESWLQRRGGPIELGIRSRQIRGCLVAQSGQGIIFLDGSDPQDEQRFTLAHEVAHFLTDYWQLRKKAIAQLGPEIIPVLDGERQPSVSERLKALISNVPIGQHVNLLPRHSKDGAMALETFQIESKTDRVALALLAPADEIFSKVGLLAQDFSTRQKHLILILDEQFGLPPAVAEVYAGLLLSGIGKGPDSWLEKLKQSF